MRFVLKKNEIILFMVLMPFLKPYNVTLIPMLDNIFKIWKLISTLYILVIFFKGPFRLHKESIWLLMFCAVWTISLVINRGPIEDYINNILSIIAIMLFFEEVNNEKIKMQLSKMFYTVGAAYMILNCITAIQGYPFFAEGMELDDNANFLGGDNYSAFILIVLSGLMFFYDVKYLKKIRAKTWIYNLFGLLSLIIPFSFMGIISYVFFLMMVIFSKFYTIIKMLNWKKIMLIGVVFVLLVSYSNLDEVMANVLGAMNKTGFNGRNMIWPLAIDAIIKKPLIGYGGLTTEQASTWILAGANHTHNILLEFPFSVGLMGTLFFCEFIIAVFRGTIRKHNNGTEILLTTLSAFVLCSIMDFYIGLVYFYLLLYMIWINKGQEAISDS
ncbi:hypothetical protein B5F29_01090 [Lachnoclostridium sp. An196]|uniref:O-antigen ligase family protein n=1 Tax=Lachnoclostridium sp. An196 TaxID=1965583 RepID=UPI000B38AB37|nr:O-antigen ligase family protein [Lachnoclostridium sp. An196]OUP22366.1 hypothetical protein B5F29_01090 [Lachnoclostridium sp. An196]